jgi:hypothetical protein
VVPDPLLAGDPPLATAPSGDAPELAPLTPTPSPLPPGEPELDIVPEPLVESPALWPSPLPLVLPEGLLPLTPLLLPGDPVEATLVPPLVEVADVLVLVRSLLPSSHAAKMTPPRRPSAAAVTRVCRILASAFFISGGLHSTWL